MVRWPRADGIGQSIQLGSFIPSQMASKTPSMVNMVENTIGETPRSTSGSPAAARSPSAFSSPTCRRRCPPAQRGQWEKISKVLVGDWQRHSADTPTSLSSVPVDASAVDSDGSPTPFTPNKSSGLPEPPRYPATVPPQHVQRLMEELNIDDLELAAQGGDSAAQFVLGYHKEQGADRESAIEWWRKASQNPGAFPPAQYKLAECYSQHASNQFDIHSAAELYASAAKAGLEVAAYKLQLLVKSSAAETKHLGLPNGTRVWVENYGKGLIVEPGGRSPINTAHSVRFENQPHHCVDFYWGRTATGKLDKRW